MPTLTYTWKTSFYRIGRDDAIRVRVAVMAAEDVTHHVFAYRLMPVNARTGERAGMFSHICSPADLVAFPAEAPDAGDDPAWFRLAFVDVLVRSREEAIALAQAIDEDLNALCEVLTRNDVLMPSGEESV